MFDKRCIIVKVSTPIFVLLDKKSYNTHRFTSHIRTSATRGKFGDLKFSIDINLGYPKARIISVKSID